MNYSDKLKDPRWQRKRLEVLQRDKFKCQACARADKTLHVHHDYYVKGRDPWNYPDWALYTLCEECHKDYQDAYAEEFMEWEKQLESEDLELRAWINDPVNKGVTF